MSNIRYTQEEHAWLREHIPGNTQKDTAERFSVLFRPITDKQVNSYCKNNHIHTGNSGRFQKGRISETKGKKQEDFMSPEGLEKSKTTRFKKGQTPHNIKPVGTERNLIGYIEVKVAEPNVWKLKHRVLWEEHYGPIPEQGRLLFRDGNPMNITLENLCLVDNRILCKMSHLKLHHMPPELFDTAVLIGRLAAETSKKKSRKG